MCDDDVRIFEKNVKKLKKELDHFGIKLTFSGSDQPGTLGLHHSTHGFIVRLFFPRFDILSWSFSDPCDVKIFEGVSNVSVEDVYVEHGVLGDDCILRVTIEFLKTQGTPQTLYYKIPFYEQRMLSICPSIIEFVLK